MLNSLIDEYIHSFIKQSMNKSLNQSIISFVNPLIKAIIDEFNRHTFLVQSALTTPIQASPLPWQEPDKQVPKGTFSGSCQRRGCASMGVVRA